MRNLRRELSFTLSSALLLAAPYLNFKFWPLAWVAIVPLLFVIMQRAMLYASHPQVSSQLRFYLRTFLIGHLFGAVFFLISCYWLTYPMIHYASFPVALAYLLLTGGTLVVGSFFGIFTVSLFHLTRKFGTRALFAAPFIWASVEFLRFQVTGQLWNALGLAHAYVPSLIQAARWGGVYAVSSLIITVNVAVAFFILFFKPKSR
ncbi:MAG: hypothetical protein ACRD63_12665, partial [Pyrinomonadaceae bacterium]